MGVDGSGSLTKRTRREEEVVTKSAQKDRKKKGKIYVG
jgi:hypothetical protein